MNTLPAVKITAPMRRVLRAIEAGTPWNARAETVEAILAADLAWYDENSNWHIGPRPEHAKWLP